MKEAKFKGIKYPTPQRLGYLKQLGYTQKDIAAVYGTFILHTVISRLAVLRTLKKLGFTRKKLTNHYSEQLSHLQKISKFKKLIPGLPQNKIIAIDECGFHLNETPRYGYSHKSSRAGYIKPGYPGNNHTLMLCIQNVAVHKAKQSCIKLGLTPIKELSESKNIETLFLPPYTPEMNPVEYCFNLIRQ
ncbi:6594_t:CDS:2 [Ambispora leptoticha]|uniref:6594_t:CDS:1 n=1 Tax=Ambispora leptoticha TaxID=144679 RepID=A0A9N9G0F2_9GLOM|nr:6594_t:CDS:2 [Ambispora leptoticha]